MSVPTKWEINRAVKASDLPSPSRLIMLTLSDSAEARTGVVPPDRAPSVSELVRETGLKESTVKKHLTLLESHGWVDRARPSATEAARHISSQYRLEIGKPVSGGHEVTPGTPEQSLEPTALKKPRGSRGNPRGGHQATPETASRGSRGDSRKEDQGSSGDPRNDDPGVTSCPPSHIYEVEELTDELLAADAAAPGALFPVEEPSPKPREAKAPRAPKHETADALVDAFWKVHGKGRAQPFIAVRGVVRAAIANGVERDDLARALDRLAKEGRAVSGGAIDVALGQIRGGTNGHGHTPWRNPEDPSDYYGEI